MLHRFKMIALSLIWGIFPVMAMSASSTEKPPIPTAVPAPPCFPQGQRLYDCYKNSMLYYYGITGSDAFMRMAAGEFHRWPEHIQSIEYARTLDETNVVRRFFSPIVGVVQLAADLTVRGGSNEHIIYELSPYIGFRWANFPWNHYLTTSFMAGEGLSYVTSIPWIERKNNDNTKRLLNAMILEATFASPAYPRLQLVARVHHRSGVYGVFHAGNTGSNDIGLGLRYLFD